MRGFIIEKGKRALSGFKIMINFVTIITSTAAVIMNLITLNFNVIIIGAIRE